MSRDLLLLVLLGTAFFPTETRAQSTKAQDAFDRGDWPTAVAEYSKLVKAAPRSSEYQARLGLSLVQVGQCQDALPWLKKPNTPVLPDELKKSVGTAGVRCAMMLNKQDDALDFIRALRHEFPRDAEVQFLSAHLFSDLSIRASQDLLFTNPSAYQVHQLNAEALEAQGRWDDAMFEYRAVLEKNSKLAGIHYRIGRLILSKPKSATTFEDAQKEFDAELSIDPHNAGAEYVLGEIAREQDHWPEAIEHFRKSVQIEGDFADALIGLGRSLSDSGKPDDAIPPLERAAKLQPDNPAASYHLAMALRRAGKRDEADKEFAVYKQASERARQLTHDVQAGVLGPQQVDPQAQP